MKFLNRLLYQVHRWVGLVLALFMFFWFFTGLVIMYSTPTTQNRSQQLAHAETLAPQLDWLSLGEAWDRSAGQRKAAADKTKAGAERKPKEAGADGNVGVGIADARLVRSAGEPLWLVEDSSGQRFALSAIDGSLRQTSADQALKIAENWFKDNDGGVINASYVETVENPVILRNQEALRPFHRIAVGDGGELLISARTGEVLHASTRMDRVFYWAGNWLHLFKPLESIGLGNIRHDVQLWLGLLATIATLAGLIIGWLRWRPGFGGKPTYSEGRTQPYREFWFKWHFWSGLIGGTVALFWALSGFIDTNPGKLFSPANPNQQEITRYLGTGLPETMRLWQPVLPILLATAVDGSDVVELGWRSLGGEAVLLAHARDGQRLPQTPDGTSPQFSEAALLAAVERVAGNAKVESRTVLTEYDSYYYPRHHQSLVEKPLPVLMVKLADTAGTRFYLDPQDGRLLAKLDQSTRIFRWLYSALHHWDFGWLYYRPLWDLWMLTWVSFGLVLGASSLVMGWRLLKKTFAPKKRAVRRTPVVAGKVGKKSDETDFTRIKEPVIDA
ncbi:PepSY domain-containing protein [Methylobacter sp.]|uniref:PepSY domain-containing protein n=1 Tax=Methylobacter sp. TaxID=2051955 RepID=UPI002FDCD774